MEERGLEHRRETGGRGERERESGNGGDAWVAEVERGQMMVHDEGKWRGAEGQERGKGLG